MIMGFVCESCRKQDHDKCRGGRTQCDCQHRPVSKQVPK